MISPPEMEKGGHTAQGRQNSVGRGLSMTELRLENQRATQLRETLLDKWIKRLLFYAHVAGRHRTACVVLIVALTIGLRCALLPWLPRPHAWVQDEFAYLLGADTFASGRLTNPAHPLWQFFEAGHIITYPTYTMKYQPGQAGFLALGQVLFGDPYWGVVISTGLMAGAICWMMQGLLLPGWALIGGLFTAATFGAGHYWIQSYWGGAVPALASALMIGAFTRIVYRGRHRFIWLFTASSALGLLTRPYEMGVLAAILTMTLIVVHVRRRSWIALRKMALPYVSGMVAWACFQMYYDWRITGNPLKLPYILHEEQYAVAPSFWMLPTRNVPRPWSPALYSIHWVLDKGKYETLANMGWVHRTGMLLRRAVTADDWGGVGYHTHTATPELFGILRYVLVFTPVLWFSRRVRRLTVLAIPLALSTCLTLWAFLHYLAPFIVVALALIFLLISYLRSLNMRGRRVGNFMVALILLYLPFRPLSMAHSVITAFSDAGNGGNALYVRERTRITATLQRSGGKHVVIVRYKPDPPPRRDWVYNSANIDAQQIIWAGDRGAVENRKLLAYYHDRHIWLLYTDESRVRLEPNLRFEPYRE
jgi:hypothetical protein